VTSVVPEGPPIRLRYRDRLHTIARSWGPERIETGWWRNGTARRDYYQVETAGAERFWLFRETGTGRWFLHGIFS
jgi:protein ImuB